MGRESITKKRRIRGKVQLQVRMSGKPCRDPFIEQLANYLRDWHRVGWYETVEVATEAGEQCIRKKNQNNRGETWEFRVIAGK